MTQKCLALSAPQRSLLKDDPLEIDVVEQPQHGSRIAAKIAHLRNLTATLTPVPATTEASHQSSMLNRFRESVETFWGDRREHGARDQSDSQLLRLLHDVDHQIPHHESLDLNTSTP